MTLTVACVLKSGGEFRRAHVRELKASVEAHLTVPHRFVCLSDLSGDGYDTIALPHDWRGWFSKISMFKPGMFDGPVFYADLDTRVVANIDDIVLGHRFTVLANFWKAGQIGSGLMAWDTTKVDLSPIYRRFLVNPVAFMGEYSTRDKWGDQAFIAANSPIAPQFWQRQHPGRVVSFRKHCTAGVPAGASVVCYGGQARPWNTQLRLADAV